MAHVKDFIDCWFYTGAFFLGGGNPVIGTPGIYS